MAQLYTPSRRAFLLGSGVLFAWSYLPKVALADGRDPRLLVIVLRGALDGLAAVAPIGDPNWSKLRGDAAMTAGGNTGGLTLDNHFALHPEMPKLHRMFKAGHAIILHAVATPYRERSHFDGQDVLESGYASPQKVDSGWLNRALTKLPAGERVGGNRSVLAVGTTAPLVVRGPAEIIPWSLPSIPQVSDDTLKRLLELYRHTDPALARVIEERVSLAAIAGVEPMTISTEKRAPKKGANVREFFARSGAAAAKFLAQPNGPRIGAMAFDGWDTHANEGQVDGRLSHLLGALDDAMGAIEANMGPAWRETVVAVVTEFGRTARINGTAGTDHGTGTVAFLAGGALKGGRVIADWPGLADNQLYEGRDLKPTVDLRAMFKGLLRDHLNVPEDALAATVFPGSNGVRPLSGLLA